MVGQRLAKRAAGGWTVVAAGGRLGGALAALLLVAFAEPAPAVEAFDGRLQAHGFVEFQIRGLNRSFAEEFDLAQWYNVFNVELEFDVAPDGWGPFDLLQAYVRAELRYDCIYTGGCGMFPSSRTWGDKSRRLPLRLRGAIDDDYAGFIDSNERTAPTGRPRRVPDPPRDPTQWSVQRRVDNPVTPGVNDNDTFNPDLAQNCPITDVPSNQLPQGCIDNRPTKQAVEKRRGFPGFDTLFDNLGPDGEVGPNQDFQNVEGFWNPDGEVPEPDGSNTVEGTYAPLFRGLAFLNDDPAVYSFDSGINADMIDWRMTFVKIRGADGGAGQTLPMLPWRPKDKFKERNQLADRAHPLRGRLTPTTIVRDGMDPATSRAAGVRFQELDCLSGTVDCDSFPYPADPVDPRLLKLQEISLSLSASGLRIDCGLGEATCGTLDLGPYPFNDLFRGTNGSMLFGGDFSGIIPCWDTRVGIPRPGNGVINPTIFVDQLSGGVSRPGCIPFTNVRVTGGDGELPMRVAPDRSNLEAVLPGVAQGIYMPSRGLIDYIEAGGDFDSHDFNINELDRSFNRGASQRYTYELKEAYLDMEFLDSRLWVRAGIQNIVWGKTELFRTTDQFNPQDLALASLPSLEESRIALLSARAVYSFYEVGPLEDVRLELAANFDRVQPADLGACGEPYTANIVCGITAGLALHGMAGVGLAGVDRPPAAWDDVDGIEFGGRVEFRWDRFSFAIVDFYGYNDLPYPDPIFFYERGIDSSTGRPLKANARSACQNGAGFIVTDPFGTGDPTEKKLIHAGNQFEEFVAPLVTGMPSPAAVRPVGERALPPAQAATVGANDDWHRRSEVYSHLGVGTDPGCLKPGGAPEFPNENRFDPALAPDFEAFLENNPPSAYSNAATDDPTPGTYIDATTGQWSLEGSSVDYALAFHPANQQLFAWICSGSIGITTALSPSSCAWNIFGTGSGFVLGFAGAPFSEALSNVFAGERNGPTQSFLGTVQANTKGSAVDVVGLAPLNSDIRDGRTTAGSITNFRGVTPDPNGDPVVAFRDQARDPADLLSMDNTLTWQQKAILGCGPAYGSRCDSGAGVLRVRINDCTSDPGDPVSISECPSLNAVAPISPLLIQACQGNQSCLNQLNALRASTFIGAVDFELERDALSASARYTPVDADGNPCTPEDLAPCRVWGPGGGVDFLNAEADVVLLSFPGIQGTTEGWTTWREDVPQPGTIGLSGRTGFGDPSLPDRAPEPFPNDVYCQRFDPNSPLADASGIVRLPGCRGAVSATVNGALETIDVVFEAHYTPRVDGCVFSRSMVWMRGAGQPTFFVRAVHPDGTPDDDLQAELNETCFNGFTNDTIPGNAASPEVPNPRPDDQTFFSYSRRQLDPLRQYQGPSQPILGVGATTLFHPFAQCQQAGVGFGGATIWNPADPDRPGQGGEQDLCRFPRRDYESDFIEGNAQVFRNELAAWSWNFMMFLVTASCNAVSGGDDLRDLDCFRPNRPWAPNRCSFSAPQFCRNVKAFINVAGLRRNELRAGGNATFGRRDFLWQSGGEAVLRYDRRNVFGVSGDWAEDTFKTNWSVEFTWVGPTPFIDNDSLSGITDSHTLNLTVSVDRPTFINFLNANRTFFMNTQWFFNYLTDYEKGFTALANRFNVLFTFTIFTGYYQDRLVPQITTVFDFSSSTGAFLPQLTYRFTDAFSMTFGVNFFVGNEDWIRMPVRGLAPTANRAGRRAYFDGVPRLLALLSDRDEAFVRLRWTF